MKVAVLKEMVAGEKRVAAVPPTVEKMVAAGMEGFVQEGAGVASGFADADYRAAGGKPETSPAALLECGDVLLNAPRPSAQALDSIPGSGALVASWRQG